MKSGRIFKMSYKLNIGCHRNTIISRDSEVREFDSRQEAYDDYLSAKKFWRSIGYIVWFAKITHPDGTVETLESNPCRY